MIVKLNSIPAWVQAIRKFEVGKNYKVRWQGKSNEAHQRKTFLLYDKDGKAMTFYENELTIYKPPTKLLWPS
jgi:hypothetical protein